jgi:hypothetical protein
MPVRRAMSAIAVLSPPGMTSASQPSRSDGSRTCARAGNDKHHGGASDARQAGAALRQERGRGTDLPCGDAERRKRGEVLQERALQGQHADHLL